MTAIRIGSSSPCICSAPTASGRDVLSRIIFGTRISMTIGLVGVALSFILGITLGGLSGFYGGSVDNLIQRPIELLRSIPTIPLWMGLAAALPSSWTPLQVFFGITIILSLIGWTGSGPGRARAFSLPAHRRFCHVCPSGRQQQDAHHQSCTWSRPLPATSSPRSPWRFRA